VSVILLSGIEQQEQLDWTEIAAIGYLDSLSSGKRGYNVEAGGRGISKDMREKMSGDKTGTPHKKAVMIKILKTGVEITHKSVIDAAKKMGVGRHTIRDLAINKRKQIKCKCGEYVNFFFTARFLD